jgi:uncharacterized protein
MSSTAQRHALNWFEIPVLDIERAQRFYEAVLGSPMRREQMGEHTLAVFPCDGDGVGGCLLAGSGPAWPATVGSMVYLNAAPSLDAVLARVERAGGRLSTPKVALPDGMGVFAHITDTEGNRVGLHALA